ncbi:MAG: HAMP domain-containing sensor histidine kinase, partial [Candidatus Elarobacter sp.]
VLDARATFADDPSDPLVARALADGGAVSDGRGRLAVALHAAGRDPFVALAVYDGERSAGPNALTVLALLAQTYTAAARNAALFDEVHQQRAAVLELSRMKGDLVTMLAHDLNNPLTTIRGFAEFLAEEHRHDSEGVAATGAIIRATERLLDLGKETLALARLEDNALVLMRGPIDYAALIPQIAIELSPAVDVVADDGASGTGDPVLIRGMFENVIGNAVKYSRPESPVRVRVRLQSDHVVIEVHDRGIGIPRDEIGGVFDRFARATNAREAEIPGTGFGLYFVRLVVQRHGGTIAIESAVDRGTSVVVRLPRDPPVNVPPAVLVLERGELAASYTEHVLRDAGYHVRIVHDLASFDDGLRTDPTATAVIPEGAHDALASAQAAGVRVVELRRPYLARDLLRALADPP